MCSIKKLVCLVVLVIATPFFSGCSDKSDTSKVPSHVISEAAKKYEGKIIKQSPANRGKEDGWYLVKNGKKSWIVDGAWLEKNGYKVSDVIEINSDEFNSIEENPQPLL